jgi:sulfite exporter TauE/SafE
MFKRHNRRTIWSHLHLWIGRLVIPIGIINGGLGFDLSHATGSGKMIAYSVIAGLMLLAYSTAVFVGERKKRAFNKHGKAELTQSPVEDRGAPFGKQESTNHELRDSATHGYSADERDYVPGGTVYR